MRTRTIPVCLAAALVTACGPSLLADATDEVGDACLAPAGGSISTAAGDDIRFWFGEQGQLYMRSGVGVSTFGTDCSVGADGGRGFRVDQATLGEHPLAAGAGSTSIANVVTGEYAAAGSIEITGYDPATRSLCGRFTAEFETRTETGTFEAQRICD